MTTASPGANATPTVSIQPAPAALRELVPLHVPARPAEVSELALFGKELEELVGLDDNWDSYGAAAPERPALEYSWELVGFLHDAGAGPPPQVFPTRRGGVQLEWHRPHTRLELEIDPDGLTGVFVFDNHSTGQTIDGELPAQMPELFAALAQVVVDR